MKRRAFTLTELLIVIAIIGVLIALIIPAVDQVREQVRRTKCRAQLSGMGKAMATYAAEYGKDKYPDIGRVTTTNPINTPINTTASLWLLIIRNHVQPENMVCPTDEVDRRAQVFAGAPQAASPFPKASNGRPSLSYSYQVPHAFYPPVSSPPLTNGNPGRDHENPVNFAIMADRSPFDDVMVTPTPGKILSAANGVSWTSLTAAAGANPTGDRVREWITRTGRYKIGANTVTALTAAERKYVNSNNHRGDGQNVLYRDGHAEWKPTPVCGIADDNIYTRSRQNKSTPTFENRTVGDAPGVAPDAANTYAPYDWDDSYLRTYPNP